jgi:IS1 family transposase
LAPLRVKSEDVYRVVELLAEGVGIRAIERLTGLNRRTVLRILEVAGRQCSLVLDANVREVKAEQVQVDELWAFVYCKQANCGLYAYDHGDQYTFLAIERSSKLIISHLVGKRTHENAIYFMQDLKERTEGRFQLTTDGFSGYTGQYGSIGAVRRVFKKQIDYGTEIKRYAIEVEGERRYSTPEVIGIRRASRIGKPDKRMICTSHAERTNLSVRIFNRRFTRLTLGYSKKLENHRLAVAIFVAHLNFCRKHSARGQTPAQASGLTDHQWTVEELLTAPAAG